MILRVQPQIRHDRVVRVGLFARLVIFLAVRRLVSDRLSVCTGVLFHNMLGLAVNAPAQRLVTFQTILIPTVDHVVAVIQNPVRPDIDKRDSSTFCIINVVAAFGGMVVVKRNFRADFGCTVCIYADTAAVCILVRRSVVRHSTSINIQRSICVNLDTPFVPLNGNICTRCNLDITEPVVLAAVRNQAISTVIIQRDSCAGLDDTLAANFKAMSLISAGTERGCSIHFQISNEGSP